MQPACAGQLGCAHSRRRWSVAVDARRQRPQLGDVLLQVAAPLLPWPRRRPDTAGVAPGRVALSVEVRGQGGDPTLGDPTLCDARHPATDDGTQGHRDDD